MKKYAIEGLDGYPNEIAHKLDDTRELLKRLDGHICHHTDCMSWQDDDYCDCAYPDLLDELAKELAND